MQSLVCVILGISSLCAVALCGKIQFRDCGSTGGTITSLDVSNCTTPPCPLKRGANTTVTMVFTPNKNFTSVTNNAYGYIGPIKTPYPLTDNNACDFMKCPLVAGTAVTYTTNVFVQQVYPTITLRIQWELHDGSDNSMLTCFQMTGQIV